MHEYELSVTES